MVFLTFPKELTEEEKMLQQKYVILQKKKKQLADIRAPKVEPPPPPIPVVSKHDLGPKADPKEVAKKLLKSGVIAPIKALPSNATTGFKRKRTASDRHDRPGSYQPFLSGGMKMEDDEEGMLSSSSSDANPSPRGERYRDLYGNFVSSKEEDKDDSKREKKRDRTRYVNRDNPGRGITVYVKGVGLKEDFLRQPMSIFGTILDLVVEEEKSCAFVTFETINEANRAIDELHNRTIDGINVQVSMAKRQLHSSSRNINSLNNPAATAGSATPSQTGTGNTNSWSSIAANFSTIGTGPKQTGTGIKKEGIKSGSRELVVYEDDIPDD